MINRTTNWDLSPAAAYLASLSPRSQRVMGDNLQRVAAWISSGKEDAHSLPWHRLDKSTFIAVQKYFSKRYSAAKVNQMLYAVRGVLRFSLQQGLISAESYREAIDFEMLQERRKANGRVLTLKQIRRLLACCDDGTIKGIRDAAILALLWGGGLKRSEIATLQLQHYERRTGRVTIGAASDQRRRVVVETEQRKHLTAWIHIRGVEEGNLFYPVTKDGTIRRRAMRDQSILDIVRERGKQAGIELLSPHDFRRTFAARQWKNGTELDALQRQMGHSNIATTLGYIARVER